MGNGKKVLIIDDDTSLLKMFESALATVGFEVAAVNGGEAALEQLKTHTFHLVVMDVMMPETDGISVLQRWPAEGKTAKGKVVLMTNLSQEAVEMETKKLGVTTCWFKDELTPQELVRRVTERLGNGN